MSKLVREEEGKKREAEMGEVAGEVGFVQLRFIITVFSTLISCSFSLQV